MEVRGPLWSMKTVGSMALHPSVHRTRTVGWAARSEARFAQGGVKMDTTVVVGIDVSKDRLDVHVHPSGECFAVGRNAEGLDGLIARLAPFNAGIVGVEATG